MKTWTETDLNDILNEGDSVYQSLKQNGFIIIFFLISDLQTIDKELCIDHADLGLILTENVTPYQNLLKCLSNIETFAFLTISCYTVAVIHDDMYYVFDPHSRNTLGLVSESGSAVLTAHCTLNELHSFLLNLSDGLSDREKDFPFEIICICK